MKNQAADFKKAAVILAFVALAGFLVYGWSEYRDLRDERDILSRENTTLTGELSLEREKNRTLSEILVAEQGKNTGFEAKIGEITSIVGNLQKLTATDPELLKKYSKIYFLNENYSPAQLSSLEPQYLYEEGRTQLIHTGVLPRLMAMIAAAKQDGITMEIVSAYRSFYDQATVKDGYKVVYGAGTANQFSADQGYSEHQLGTAVDFTTTGMQSILTGFEKTAAYAWLTANAHKNGFVLSYPSGNSYYQFEPWHWRFVGVALSGELKNTGKNFYDLDQREIDGYLITLFN